MALTKLMFPSKAPEAPYKIKHLRNIPKCGKVFRGQGIWIEMHNVISYRINLNQFSTKICAIELKPEFRPVIVILKNTDVITEGDVRDVLEVFEKKFIATCFLDIVHREFLRNQSTQMVFYFCE
ncbi:hypothetical protein [Agrobacterium sp. 22117]|uniref:hypothetical protein n=1 Tax=Agrobacterium sp. 22117 TaxID=3453880 RepID=UPI003F87F020